MNLSMKWLSDYVDITATPREYAEALTMSGSKVEGYEIEGSEIENVVVGKVLSIDKHPDADKLRPMLPWARWSQFVWTALCCRAAKKSKKASCAAFLAKGCSAP